MADLSIYRNLLAPVRSPDEVAAGYIQAEGQRMNLLAARQQMQEQQRSRQEQEQIRNALGGLGGGATDEQRVQALRGTGLIGGYTMADSLEKSIGERAKTAAQTKKDNAESAKVKMATLSQIAQGALLAHQQGGPQAGQQAYQAGLQAAKASGQFDDNDLQRIAPQFDPQGAMAFVDYDKALTRALTMRGQDVTQQTAREGHQVTMRGQNMTDSRTREEGAAGRAVTMRGQNLTDARTRELNEIARDEKARTAKPTEPQQRVADATEALALLDQAEPLLGKATNSYIGQGVDQAARAIGKSTPGSEAAAQLKALEGALIAKMPKMSGPQSDKDVLLYKQMAGQIGDPTIPADQKRAAIKTIREINQRQAGQAAKPAAPAGPKPSVSNW
jgi:hypothetical protein